MSGLPSTNRTHHRGAADRPALRIVVTGSRDWTDRAAIRRRLEHYAPVGDVEVLHGAAPGADTIAAEEADELGMRVRSFPADWRVTADTPTGRIRRRRDGSLYDAAAGVIRNRGMLDEQPDIVLAFQRNGSKGTQDCIDEALRRRIQVVVETEGAR